MSRKILKNYRITINLYNYFNFRILQNQKNSFKVSLEKNKAYELLNKVTKTLFFFTLNVFLMLQNIQNLKIVVFNCQMWILKLFAAKTVIYICGWYCEVLYLLFYNNLSYNLFYIFLNLQIICEIILNKNF